MKLLITIAICTHNRARLLRQSVASVLPQMTEDAELLVMDNASTDETGEVITRLAENPRVKICHEEKLGLSHARNSALQNACGEFVIFLDDDALVQPGWLAGYRRFLSKSPRAHIGGAGGAVEPNFEIPPPSWLAFETGRVRERHESRRCEIGENPWGCNFAVQRELAIKVGGFNPALGHQGNISGAYEEVELMDRIRRAGGEIWWVKNVGVRHFVEAKRLRLGWQLSNEFRAGRCRAARRLDALPGRGRRIFFIVIRVAVAPLQCLPNLLLAAASFPFQCGSLAVRALTQVCGCAGFALELLRRLFDGCRSSRPVEHCRSPLNQSGNKSGSPA